MSVFIRLTLIISFIAAVCIYLNGHPSFALHNPGVERQKHLQTISGLEEEAGRLAQELLVLDLKLKKSQQEKESVEGDLTTTRIKRDQALEEYKRSLENKNQSLKKIGHWVNFQYRHGYWSLMDIIMGSESLTDLAHRSVMVAIILDRQAGDYKKAADACASSLQREKALAGMEGLLASQNQSLAEQIKSIQSLSDQRKEFLAEIKNRSRDLSLRVAALESKFLNSLNLLDLVTGALAGFSWHEVRPDRILVGSGGIQVELSESTLNGFLKESRIKDLEGLSVSLRPGQFILSGRDKYSSSTFAMGGILVPSGQSAAVRFEPKTLSLDGIPVAEEVVSEMSVKSAIELSIPGDMRLKPSRIEIGNEKMGITLNF